MLTITIKIKQWIKNNQKDIVLFVGVILISLFSFAMGYLVCKEELKQPLIFETIEEEFLNND